MKQNLRHYLFVKNKLQPLVILFLLFCAPPFVFILWHINASLEGSINVFMRLVAEKGLFAYLFEIWGPVFFGTPVAWTMLTVFALAQLFFMKALPGKTFVGPVSPKGNRPVYKANGVLAFTLTLTLFYLCGFVLGLFPPTIIYDNFGALLGALNIFSLFFCLFLLVKGIYFPSSTDAGSNGNVLLDYYWGTELYPRVLGWDVKMFTNCRFAMMGWPIILFSFAAKQQELYGLSDSMAVAVALQVFYVAKFFFWETGYLSSLDIMHDRAGFYICWGCLVWVPGVYTSSTLFLVHHPNHLGVFLALFILSLGSLAIALNYFADRQRQRVRQTNGNCLVWKRRPCLLTVKYQTADSEWKENLLLCSGWWGIARHFHYLLEILAAFFWTVPALFDNLLPYFYVVFLTILLTERAYRDDKRCSDKYGEGWNLYCKHVPFKIIPFVF